MKINKKKGFTLVELLAVIVILAIILVIAVPKVMSVIEDSKKATLESTAKMIASSAEKAKVQNTVLGKVETITCDSVAKINKLDYETCEVVFEDNTAKVSIKGSGKFAGLYVCDGDKTEATAQNESCGFVSLIVDADGGTETTYNEKYEAGTTVTLIEPTKEGYTFVNWIVESGEGAAVNGNTLTMGSDATKVKAIWKKINYLSQHDWATIVTNVQSGNYPYEVGDTKAVDMGDLGTYTLRVANTTKCNEVEVTSKTACGFVLEFTDVITGYNMNPSGEYNGTQYRYGTNLGGWPASAMRKYLNDLDTTTDEDGVIYNALPEELRNGIINTYVVSSHGSNATAGNLENENAGVLESSNYWSNDKLYLLSAYEVWGSSAGGYDTMATGGYDTAATEEITRQLDYYAEYEGEGYTGVSTSNYSGAIKNDSSGSASMWWLRSAVSNTNYTFYSVGASGTWSNGNASGRIGIGGSPAFRLAN